MEEYAVDVLPGEIIPWARAAMLDETPVFTVRASREYQVERDFDREEHRLGEGEDISLVTVTGRLTMAPAGDGRDWMLELRAQESLGLVPAGDERGYEDDPDMTVEAFVRQFLLPEKGEVDVVLHAESAEAADRFQRWLSDQRQS